MLQIHRRCIAAVVGHAFHREILVQPRRIHHAPRVAHADASAEVLQEEKVRIGHRPGDHTGKGHRIAVCGILRCQLADLLDCLDESCPFRRGLVRCSGQGNPAVHGGLENPLGAVNCQATHRLDLGAKRESLLLDGTDHDLPRGVANDHERAGFVGLNHAAHPDHLAGRSLMDFVDSRQWNLEIHIIVERSQDSQITLPADIQLDGGLGPRCVKTGGIQSGEADEPALPIRHGVRIVRFDPADDGAIFDHQRKADVVIIHQLLSVDVGVGGHDPAIQRVGIPNPALGGQWFNRGEFLQHRHRDRVGVQPSNRE